MITDSEKYEETYRKRMFGMAMYTRSMIEYVSGIVVDEFRHAVITKCQGEGLHHTHKGDNEAGQPQDGI